ncbi:hypothetical protein SynRS9915_00499 [Synechococcus sp. RS9915]|nr:hypothetical protein SynRS9915_00499 [Synechococcus sp. RS9915]
MKKIAALLLWLTIEIDRYWTFLIWHLIFKEKYIVSKKNLVNSSLLKLELGGGETPRLKYENYLNVDTRSLPEVDININFKDDITEKFASDSVSAVYSRHMLEHLAYYEIPDFLSSLAEITFENGIIEIIVPSINYHIFQRLLFSHDTKSYNHALAGFHGWQRCENQGYWDVHKSSFTKSDLVAFISSVKTDQDVFFKPTSLKNIHLIWILKK